MYTKTVSDQELFIYLFWVHVTRVKVPNRNKALSHVHRYWRLFATLGMPWKFLMTWQSDVFDSS